MAQRFDIILACLAGCVVAALFGLWAMIKFDAPIIALLSVALFPAGTCYLAGLHDRKQLSKIAVYAVLGWALGFMLQPVVSVGHEWQIPASSVSTLLALVGAVFVPAASLTRSPCNSDAT